MDSFEIPLHLWYRIFNSFGQALNSCIHVSPFSSNLPKKKKQKKRTIQSISTCNNSTVYYQPRNTNSWNIKNWNKWRLQCSGAWPEESRVTWDEWEATQAEVALTSSISQFLWRNRRFWLWMCLCVYLKWWWIQQQCVVLNPRNEWWLYIILHK